MEVPVTPLMEALGGLHRRRLHGGRDDDLLSGTREITTGTKKPRVAVLVGCDSPDSAATDRTAATMTPSPQSQVGPWAGSGIEIESPQTEQREQGIQKEIIAPAMAAELLSDLQMEPSEDTFKSAPETESAAKSTSKQGHEAVDGIDERRDDVIPGAEEAGTNRRSDENTTPSNTTAYPPPPPILLNEDNTNGCGGGSETDEEGEGTNISLDGSIDSRVSFASHVMVRSCCSESMIFDAPSTLRRASSKTATAPRSVLRRGRYSYQGSAVGEADEERSVVTTISERIERAFLQKKAAAAASSKAEMEEASEAGSHGPQQQHSQRMHHHQRIEQARGRPRYTKSTSPTSIMDFDREEDMKDDSSSQVSLSSTKDKKKKRKKKKKIRRGDGTLSSSTYFQSYPQRGEIVEGGTVSTRCSARTLLLHLWNEGGCWARYGPSTIVLFRNQDEYKAWKIEKCRIGATTSAAAAEGNDVGGSDNTDGRRKRSTKGKGENVGKWWRLESEVDKKYIKKIIDFDTPETNRRMERTRREVKRQHQQDKDNKTRDGGERDILDKPSTLLRVHKFGVMPIKVKKYSWKGPKLFTFKVERWTDAGPGTEAAFASKTLSEVRNLRDAMVDCMDYCADKYTSPESNSRRGGGGSRRGINSKSRRGRRRQKTRGMLPHADADVESSSVMSCESRNSASMDGQEPLEEMPCKPRQHQGLRECDLNAVEEEAWDGSDSQWIRPNQWNGFQGTIKTIHPPMVGRRGRAYECDDNDDNVSMVSNVSSLSNVSSHLVVSSMRQKPKQQLVRQAPAS